MRKFMFLLLLAGAATPAIASPFHRSDDARPEQSDRQQLQQQEQQQQQQQSSDNHHAERANANADRPHVAGYARSNEQAPAAVQGYSGNGQALEARRQHFGGYQGGGQEAVAVQPAYGGNPSAEAQGWRSRERRPSNHDQAGEQQGGTPQYQGSSGSWRQLDRPLPNVMHTRVPVVSNVPREGTQPPLAVTQQYARNHGNWSGRNRDDWSGRNQGNWSGRNQSGWNGNWRNDRRYNWQDQRRRHSDWFHLGAYYDPFGWGYQSFSIGWRLWPNYYSDNYWFNPEQYGLPYPPEGCEWVRYYDDALLVDTYSGEVVDVIRDFFW